MQLDHIVLSLYINKGMANLNKDYFFCHTGAITEHTII